MRHTRDLDGLPPRARNREELQLNLLTSGQSGLRRLSRGPVVAREELEPRLIDVLAVALARNEDGDVADFVGRKTRALDDGSSVAEGKVELRFWSFAKLARRGIDA